MKVLGTLACLAFVVVCQLIIRHVQAKKAARGEDVISPAVRHFERIRADQAAAPSKERVAGPARERATHLVDQVAAAPPHDDPAESVADGPASPSRPA